MPGRTAAPDGRGQQLTGLGALMTTGRLQAGASGPPRVIPTAVPTRHGFRRW